MSEEDLPLERELNYFGMVDIEKGTLMGRGMNGKIWAVQGCMYNPVTDKTTVLLQEFIQQ